VYYYQLVHYVRKFKGLEAPLEKASPVKRISIGKADDWDDVTPYYRHYRTIRCTATTTTGINLNTTGRNDIVGAKLARDDASIYILRRNQRTAYAEDRSQLDDAGKR
jgi:hypothetical protein